MQGLSDAMQDAFLEDGFGRLISKPCLELVESGRMPIGSDTTPKRMQGVFNIVAMGTVDGNSSVSPMEIVHRRKDAIGEFCDEFVLTWRLVAQRRRTCSQVEFGFLGGGPLKPIAAVLQNTRTGPLFPKNLGVPTADRPRG